LKIPVFAQLVMIIIGIATGQKTGLPEDLELTLPSNKSETISTRYKQTDELVQKLSSAKYGDAQRVKLVVVTKGQPHDACLEVVSAGAQYLGENYPEETVAKYSLNDIGKKQIHMIGHLQSRKIKFLHPLFSCIHSIDSLELAQKVSNYYVQKGKKIDVLIEIDLSGDSTKNGFIVNNQSEKNHFESYFLEMQQLNGIRIIGLMTMGHNPETPEVNREIFKNCHSIFNTLQKKYRLSDFSELSMGTSGDFAVAISEGSTMVRIGQRIMGNRLYK
jgi:pyridoxal phosphate enzyme (YggS family)